MKTLSINTLFIFLACMFLISCSSTSFISDHLDNDYYAEVGSYNVEGECAKNVSKIQAIRVSNSIHSFFKNNGYQRSENPDLLIQYFVKENNEAYTTSDCDYYSRWAYGEACALRVINYQEGAIVIDIVDTNSQSIIWHGAIYGPPFESLKDPNDIINKNIEELLQEYFIGHKS